MRGRVVPGITVYEHVVRLVVQLTSRKRIAPSIEDTSSRQVFAHRIAVSSYDSPSKTRRNAHSCWAPGRCSTRFRLPGPGAARSGDFLAARPCP